MEQLKRIRKNLTSSQIFFLLLMIPIGCLGPIIYQCCDKFNKYRNLERPDYENSQWEDFYLILVCAPLLGIIKYLIRKLSRGYFYNNLKHKYQGEALDFKITKSTKNFFKIFYFTFITSFGFYVYSGTVYQSSTMFGSGNHLLNDSDWPYNKPPAYLKLYYMMNMSYHVEETVQHFLLPAQNDFFEMLLHHYITMCLIGGSYMTHFWNSGINVMIQMDHGDIFAGVIKAFMDFTSTPFVLVTYICLVTSWIYFRIYAFSYEVIWEGSMIGRWKFDHNTSHQYAFQLLLIGLLILNVYWVFLFFKMGLRFLTKGEVKDIQNPVEDTYKKQTAPPKVKS